MAKVDLASGNLDTVFTQAGNGLNGAVNTLTLSLATSSIYVGGAFNQYQGGYLVPYFTPIDPNVGFLK